MRLDRKEEIGRDKRREGRKMECNNVIMKQNKKGNK